MLKRLTVRNLAVVESAEIDFTGGLNVITGETGAGKSVIMGALDLVLGARADASLVREGCKEAEVEACFACSEEGRMKSEELRLINVRRTVTKEGKSRAWIDDESVTIAELKEKTASLVDIHGPRANQRLLEESFQRETVDGLCNFGSPREGARGTSDPMLRYSTVFRELSDLNTQLSALNAQLSSEDELDMLRFQVNELEEAGISAEDDNIAERHAAAAHAEDIVEAANVITEALGGDDGADRSIAKARQGIAAAEKHFPSAAGWREQIEEIAARIEELSRSVADAASKVDIDEDEFRRLDARLGVVNRMKRKYGDPVAALEKKRARLDLLEHREERLAELRGRIAAATKEVKSVGAKLTKLRRESGAKLAKAVTKELRELGFLRADFEVAIEPIEPESHGCDRVTFMFGPNPGEPMRPLSAIASSGEIARVMLALKVIGSSVRSQPQPSTSTLVFDEIDANIGGEIGAVVGEKLRSAAKGGQVIAITHLPQSAVWGERHLVVAKRVSGGRTRTEVFPVSGDERIGEIARMLGGEKITTVVKRHAKELIELSR